MKIPLADVIAHRHLLSSREAATLTLAVGRAWDRKRSRVGERPLPNVTHMELTDRGAVTFTDSFTESPADGPATGDTTLSGLLGQLLGHEVEHARHQLPSSREDEFRRALLRFANEDPGVMADVFTRMVTARKAADAEVAQARLAVPVRRRLTEVLAAGAVALLLTATGFVIGAMRTPLPVPERPVTQLRTSVQLPRPSTDASIRTIAPAPRKTTIPARLVTPASRPRLEPVPERKRPENPRPTTFAGGSRAIAWSQTTR